MSDNWLRVIPTSPIFVPTASGAQQARTLLDRFTSVDDGGLPATVLDKGKIVFIDAGSNVNQIQCPWCDGELELIWWQDRMAYASSTSFRDLLVRTPCCDVTTSLNDLRYDWPQGFARWWLELMNPSTESLSGDQLAMISEALGHPARVIRTRY